MYGLPVLVPDTCFYLAQATSYLSSNTDDDDISAFVQDIDARKPLPSRREGSESPAGPLPPQDHGREATITEESSSTRSSDVAPTAGPSRQRTLSTPFPGPVLATESAVGERLREMNETFLASLQGLGSGSRRREASTATDRAARNDRPGPPIRPPSYSGSLAARRESPLASSSVPPSPQTDSAGASGAINMPGVPLPPLFVRPRVASTGSVRSGFSIASEEVLGRMDPEPSASDERRRSRGPLAG